MRLLGITMILAMAFSSCSKLKVEEGIEGEDNIPALVLGKVEFKGGATIGDGDTFSDSVTVFPGEDVKISCETVNATNGKITFASDTGFTPAVVDLKAMDFPDCTRTNIDTTGWVPGTYTATIDIADAQGKTATNTFAIIVQPRVIIQNVVVTNATAALDLYYPHGVGNGTLTINGAIISGFPRDFDQNGPFTHRVPSISVNNINTAQFVAGVTMNRITGPDDTYVLSNQAPRFTITNPSTASRTITGCRAIGEADFTSGEEVIFTGGHPDPRWAWDGDTLEQFLNSSASAVISSRQAESYTIKGLWKTTSGDDDFWGLVFGYKDASEFKYFDFKKGMQGLAYQGVRIRDVNLGSIKRVNDASFWSQEGGQGVSTLVENRSFTWIANQNYAFQIDVEPNRVKVEVRDGSSILSIQPLIAEIEATGLSTAGKWGFYSFSQANNIFSTLTACGYGGAQPYRYTAAATDADGDQLHYLKTAGPAGLSVNSSNGEITWNTPILGTHPVTILVSDSRGGLATFSTSLIVNAPF